MTQTVAILRFLDIESDSVTGLSLSSLPLNDSEPQMACLFTILLTTSSDCEVFIDMDNSTTEVKSNYNALVDCDASESLIQRHTEDILFLSDFP